MIGKLEDVQGKLLANILDERHAQILSYPPAGADHAP
jgi:hypothetical protein